MIVNKICNKYSLGEKIKLLFILIRTRLICSKARIIRNEFTIRGRKYIDLGTNLTTGRGCRLEAFMESDSENKKKIIFGDNVQLNDYVHISAISKVQIGSFVLMASHVYISDNSHGVYKGMIGDTSPDIPPIRRPYYVQPVKIGSRVWIGEGVIVMPGVTIGDGAIIGAHSIVNQNIPSNSIAVGSPAKVIKRWDEISSKWIKIS